MSRPWTAERVVTEDEARALVALVAPELDSSSPRPLGAGWDNTAWLVDDPHGAPCVFRFPRRQVAVSCMEAELSTLPLFPPLPAAVTRPLWSGRMPAGDTTWPFAGYRYLKGDVLATSGPVDNDLAHALGVFLRAVHALETAPLVAAGLARDSIARLDVARRMAPVGAALALAAHTGIDTRPHLEALELGVRVGPIAEAEVVCHGDLDQRHVLVEGGRLVGVIDWGDVHLGHAPVDLALAFSFPVSTRHAFFSGYGPISQHVEVLARARAIMTAARVYEWALDIGDHALAAYARRALEATLQ